MLKLLAEDFMKKLISIIALFSFLAGVFAQENIEKIQSLIEDGVEKNSAEIGTLASSLSNAEKELIYTKNEVPWWPVFLNAFVGFGVGSYIQGDTKEAVRATVCDSIALTGITVCYAGMYSLILKNQTEIADDPNRSKELSDEDFAKQIIPWTAGMLSFAGFATISTVISIVKSIKYPIAKNEVLRNTLFTKNATEVSSKQKPTEIAFAPIFSLNQDLSFAPGIACEIKFNQLSLR